MVLPCWVVIQNCCFMHMQVAKGVTGHKLDIKLIASLLRELKSFCNQTRLQNLWLGKMLCSRSNCNFHEQLLMDRYIVFFIFYVMHQKTNHDIALIIFYEIISSSQQISFYKKHKQMQKKKGANIISLLMAFVSRPY